MIEAPLDAPPPGTSANRCGLGADGRHGDRGRPREHSAAEIAESSKTRRTAVDTALHKPYLLLCNLVSVGEVLWLSDLASSLRF
jgi:hypothetical protein